MIDKVSFFFEGWDPILRILVVGTLSYLILLVLLRISGKRTLSQMSGFDFIITVAIGSTFGRLITAQEVALAESATAFLLLIFLQICFAWLNMKFGWFSKLLKAQPSLLFYQGAFLPENIRSSRISEQEIISAIRQQGIESLDEVEAVVLEASGGWSVVKKSKKASDAGLSTLALLKEERSSGRQGRN